MDKTDARYYEIEYFSYAANKLSTKTVRANSFIGAIFALERSCDDEILSIKLLKDREEIKKPAIAALEEKIARNEKRIYDLEWRYNELNARLHELWLKFNTLKYDLKEDQE